MTLSKLGRAALAFVAAVAMGLGMTSCGGGTIGFMWVLGTQYNQVAGYKIDDYTGNLTSTVGSPYTSGGTNPVMLVVKSGGRYVYVLNAGSPTITTVAGVSTISNNSSNISIFSVGGDGTLNYQESFPSAGYSPIYLTTDTSGNFLYVLDQVSPDAIAAGCLTTLPQSTANCFGDITAYALDPDTGRATLLQNQSFKNANGTQLTYFNVGLKPIMMKYATNGCLYTLDAGNQSLFPYSASGGTGQLVLTTNAAITTGASQLTSINGNASYLYLTDAGANQILPYTYGTNCALNTVTGGSVNNLLLTSNPVYSFIDAKGKFLYVLNQSGTNVNNANSTISAFVIESTGQLQAIAGSPYGVGAGPMCMVEDPTDQYVYTSNFFDGTVTGKLINQNTGELALLSRGSTFNAFAKAGATCLVISGNID